MFPFTHARFGNANTTRHVWMLSISAGCAQAQCASCNISDSCTDLGCSLDFLARNATPCCNYCCPKNFTEQAFADDPALYAKHPPTFLVQHTTLDVNADTCAAKMYHEAMTMLEQTRHSCSFPPTRKDACVWATPPSRLMLSARE